MLRILLPTIIEIFFICLVVVPIIFVIVKINSKNKKPVNKIVQRSEMAEQFYQNNPDGHKPTQSSFLQEMEDRNNDWLAQQLREEQIAKERMSSMLALKLEHEAHCDAQKVQY